MKALATYSHFMHEMWIVLSPSIIALRYKVYAKKNYINYVLTTCTFTKYKIIFVIHTLPFSYDVNNRLVGFKVNFNIK